MLFLGIDQHARQLTISLRDQHGDVLLARQVSTQPAKILEFFDQLTRRCARSEKQFIAVVEVCAFNDWLIRMLRDYRCHKVILIQPEERKRCKTDRRDASALSELLQLNRDRFLEGRPVRGLRQVDISSTSDQQNRKLTTLRKEPAALYLKPNPIEILDEKPQKRSLSGIYVEMQIRDIFGKQKWAISSVAGYAESILET